MRKAEKELKKQLKQDVEIPSIVRRKANMAFTEIKKEAKQDEARKIGRVVMPRKRIAIVAAALTLAIGTGTVAAVQYAKWSDGVNTSVHGTDKQKEKLEKQGYTSYPNVSTTKNGITVTATQCVADSYGAIISLKIEGYQPPKGKEAVFESMWVESSKNTSSMSASGGFYEVSTNKDGSINNVKEDGTMEYVLGMQSAEKGSMIGKRIHIDLSNIGYDLGRTDVKVEKKGTWSLAWTLEGSTETQKFDFNKEFGNTGTKLIRANISALGLEIISEYPKECNYTDANGEQQPPAFAGVKMKNGKVYLGIADGGASEFQNDNKYRTYKEVISTNQILDINQIESLLFFKKNLDNSKAYKAENYYEIPLNIEK